MHAFVDAVRYCTVSTYRIVGIDEWVEWASVHRGSFRVVGPDGEVTGRFNVQEAIVNFTPDEPLQPSTTYEVWLPAGGVADISGNPMDADLRFAFTTASEATASEPTGTTE